MKVDIFNTDKKYNIIYADPPWKYNSRNNKNTRFGGGAIGHYSLMSFDDIAKLPIENIAADNCALFMWCTFPKLPQQLNILKSWGFKYKTIGFNWIKTNKRNGKPFFGIGYYTKSNSEICILATRGKMKPVSNKVSSIVIEPRREHSRKPDCIRWKIVELFGDLPRIELFARQNIDGWDCWGDQAPEN